MCGLGHAHPAVTQAICEQAGTLVHTSNLFTIDVQSLCEHLHGPGSVVEVRGKGLMVGIELNRPCRELVSRALAQGLVINVTAGNVIRLLPASDHRPAQIDLLGAPASPRSQ